MPKEIVTLSFGSYASFVSAHYWNLQDEAAGYSGREGWSDFAATTDHNVLFSEVEGRNGALSYRPRAVLFDIAGSSGGVSFSADAPALAPLSDAGASAPAVSTWRGSCEVHRSAPVARSAFLERLEEHEELDWEGLGDEEAAQHQAALEAAARQLDPAAGPCGRGTAAGGAGAWGTGPARHWTDFCKVVFHPRAVFLLPGSWSGPYDHSLAAGWGAAADLLGPGAGGGGCGLGGVSGAVVEEAVDRLRYLTEACDRLAGFQVFADDLTGFGALATGVLAEAVEEYAGRPLVVFSLRRPGQGSVEQELTGRSSTASATSRAREELSQALALTHMAELASLYVPIAAPADRITLPYLSYSNALPFHTSAVLSSAIDTALLPTRLADARSPLGVPLGASDLHSLVRLLCPAGRGAANLAALHLALPCASLPADHEQLRRQLDERLRPPHASAAALPPAATVAGAEAMRAAATTASGSGAAAREGAAAAAAPPRSETLYGCTAQMSLGDLASLTPGISGRDGGAGRGSSRAESYCLRGGRTDAGPASTSDALAALDLMLRRQPHRLCVRHRCVTPMPLPVPLPFPFIFADCVQIHGDVFASAPPTAASLPTAQQPPQRSQQGTGLGAESGQGRGPGAPGAGGSGAWATSRPAGQAVHSAPVLTRLQATSEFDGWVQGVRGRWIRAAGGAAGRAVLDAWGLGRDDTDEVGARLRELAASFADEDEE